MPGSASFRFYAELNVFLPPGRRQVKFDHPFYGKPTVKDLIESLGVPHTEVDLIIVNAISVDFSCRVSDGDQISVYPVFEAIDITPILQVRPEPLREPRFIIDTYLGKLATYLRMLGFDSLYKNSYTADQLAVISAAEHRILLTRDRALLKRSKITHGYLVRSEEPQEQVKEVLQRFDLVGAIQPFCLCLRCNLILEDAAADEVIRSVPPRVRENVKLYRWCPGCKRIYWKGTHYNKMLEFINSSFLP